jgi:hypothetical protein
MKRWIWIRLKRWIRIRLKRWIRIRIKVLQIRNPWFIVPEF